MRVFYSRYELQPLVRIKMAKRYGALLKVVFDSGIIGYADCHPWHELGDLPLQSQLDLLAQGKCTPLLSCALEHAEIDGQSRSLGKSIFTTSSRPKSHFLVPDLLGLTKHDVQEIIQSRHTHVKIKIGKNMEAEREQLHALFLDTPLYLRLDCNERLNPDICLKFLNRISSLKLQIEFIEDPFPFDFHAWKAIQDEGWTLAADREAHLADGQPLAAKVLIVKPAIHSRQLWKQTEYQTRIVTSYLGHPLDQVVAAYVATQVDPQCLQTHGLSSHLVYQPNVFSRCLQGYSHLFIAPLGSGFGFDRELEQLQWMTL